jgi:hypothetical protein
MALAIPFFNPSNQADGVSFLGGDAVVRRVLGNEAAAIGVAEA